jgi:hypothetical protein
VDGLVNPLWVEDEADGEQHEHLVRLLVDLIVLVGLRLRGGHNNHSQEISALVGQRVTVPRQCYGSGMFISDSTFFHPGSEFFPSRIHIKEFKYFNPKKLFLSSRKYDSGCSSRIRILIFYPSRIQGSKRHQTGSATLYSGHHQFIFSPNARSQTRNSFKYKQKI